MQQEWPAEDYAIGSYIQATIADRYLAQLPIKHSDTILDVGCGNGAFSKKILQQVPAGGVLGIDPSASMLKLADNVCAEFPNFRTQQLDVCKMTFSAQFDGVVSFWCLQWVPDIVQAFENMYAALKPQGFFFTLFPSGDDAFISSFKAVKAAGIFPELETFIAPVDYSKFTNLGARLAKKFGKNIEVLRLPQKLLLPSFDVFRKFINGIGFYQGQIAVDKIKEINEAMVAAFTQECVEKYQGRPEFNCSIYLVKGKKG